MSVNVSMQSPIPDYGNFGAVVSRAWIAKADRDSANYNAALERGLRLKVHEDTLKQNKKEFDETLAYNKGIAVGTINGMPTIESKKFMLEREKWNEDQRKNQYAWDVMKEESKILGAKLDYKKSKLSLDAKYDQHLDWRKENRSFMDYLDFWGQSDTGYWHEPSYDEWLESSGQFLTDEAKTVEKGGPALSYTPSIINQGTVGLLHHKYPWESTSGPSTPDYEIAGDGLLDLYTQNLMKYKEGQ